MAVRLGEYVICGEIYNTSNYSVHGWIRLRGQEHPLLLQLTGNCDADLAGRHIRFESRNAEQLEAADAPADDELSYLATQQVGPTGTMTAARQVKVFDCPPTEFYLRSKMDEPPPTEWKRCLYLEWYSQNGRVVVELPDPVLEFIDAEQEAAERAEREEKYRDREDTGGLSSVDIESVLGDLETDDSRDGAADAWNESDPDGEFDQEDEEDPYGLFPADLNRQLENDAAQVDLSLRGDGSREWYEMELMDDLIENSDGVPLDELFDGPLKLPRPDQLGSDEEAETALKTLLAQLALFGISLDICPHFTPRDAYRLLLEEICPGETAYPELRNTQWVQHFMTSEFCPQCEAEFEREFEDREHQHKENPNDTPDDDLPF